MRLFAFIMAVTMVGLTLFPCADSWTSPSKAKQELAATSDNREDAADDCSPFCHCTCCTGLSVIQAPVSLSFQKVYDTIAYNADISSAPVEISYPIFQPPKL